MPRFVSRFALPFALCLAAAPAFADQMPRTDDPAITCANLFNWSVRHAEDLPPGRLQRVHELLSTIADPQVYSVPSQTECASVLQILVQEGFDISDLGLRPVLGITPACDSVLPFVQDRLGAVEEPARGRLRGLMGVMGLPEKGSSNDLLACSVLHGELDRQNLFEVMQEF
jgi:hypothetical protein